LGCVVFGGAEEVGLKQFTCVMRRIWMLGLQAIRSAGRNLRGTALCMEMECFITVIKVEQVYDCKYILRAYGGGKFPAHREMRPARASFLSPKKEELKLTGSPTYSQLLLIVSSLPTARCAQCQERKTKYRDALASRGKTKAGIIPP